MKETAVKVSQTLITQNILSQTNLSIEYSLFPMNSIFLSDIVKAL
jgi:hypothetical protein